MADILPFKPKRAYRLGRILEQAGVPDAFSSASGERVTVLTCPACDDQIFHITATGEIFCALCHTPSSNYHCSELL